MSSWADRGTGVGWISAHVDADKIRAAIVPWLRAESIPTVEQRLHRAILLLKISEQAIAEAPLSKQQNAALERMLSAIESLTGALDDIQTAEHACDDAEVRARRHGIDIDDLVARTKHDLRLLSVLFDTSQIREVRRGNPRSALAAHRATIRETLEAIFDEHARPNVAVDREAFVQAVADALELPGFENRYRQRKYRKRQ